MSTRFPPGPGGVERHVAEISPRLAARGHAVEVFTSDLYREFPWQRLDPTVPREERTPWGSVHRIPVWTLPGELHYPIFRGLGQALDSARPELVHVHTYGTNQVAVARRLHRRRGTPYVLTAHFHPIWSIEGGWLRHQIRGFYDRRLAGPMVRDAARVIVQTGEEEKLLLELGLPLPPRVVVPPGYTPLPAPTPETASFAARHGVKGPFLLFVGRLASNKGLLDLVRAFSRFAPGHPEAELVLAGEDGGQGPAVDAEVRRLGLGAKVHRIGHVDDDRDLAQAYREARCVVLPSEYEAFGLVLLEALAAGTPVVASRVGGIPDFIEDGRAGLLVPPRSPEALAAAIERIWTDEALARSIGAYGRDRVVPKYTWDALADRLDAVYREVVRA